jgi:hypothetical protein
MWFTPAEREGVREHVLALGRADPRVVGGALVGGSARGEGRWSDVDISFGVEAEPRAVLDDWTPRLAEGLGAVALFDLPAGSALYRVFLVPGCLQLDVSCVPAAEFGARGPDFRLLFGDAAAPALPEPPAATQLFGLGVHHALRARVCIERGRHWQAEHWISAVRDEAVALACRRHGLDTGYARGAHELPAGELADLEDTLVRSLDEAELHRALGAAVAALLRQSAEAVELAAQVEPQLRALSTWPA